MKKTRLPIPVGLADMPPGPELATVLAEIDLSRLGGLDCVTVMRAQHRQSAHEQARLMAAMVEVGRCGVGSDDALPRMDAPDEFSGDEIRGALVWTRAAADAQLSLAWDLCSRLPQVFATLERGNIDVPKAKVFSEWTSGLTQAQAQQVCDALLPAAPELTTGQLAERIKKLAIAIDPDWARRRYEEAVRERKVVGYRNEDGSANVCGYQLPADRAAAACAHLDALARKIKHSGDGRPIGHIRADVYLAMLDGSYTGWPEADIIAHVLATGETGPGEHEPGRGQSTHGRPPERGGHGDHDADPAGGVPPFVPAGGSAPIAGDGGFVGRSAHAGAPTEDPRPPEKPHATNAFDHDAEPAPVGGSAPRQAGHGTAGPSMTDGESAGEAGAPSVPRRRVVRRAGVEVRVELTTLLGLDDHPGEVAGSGPVLAGVARRLVGEQTAAEWRYAVTDEDGRLLFEGITSRRPYGYPARAEAPARGGIVELQVRISTLRALAARPARLGDWTKVIADLARQAERHEQTDRHARVGRQEPADHGDGCQGEQAERPAHDDRRQAERFERSAADDRRQTERCGRAGHDGGCQGERCGSECRDGPATPGQHSGEGDARGPRSPGRPLRRRTEIRDRTCTHPRCRAPAHGTDGDHIQEWARGGATREGNIGSACRHDHRLRHDGGWRVVKLASGRLVWISRLGVRYQVRPPLIIQPLPAPAPREPVPPNQPDDHDNGPIWREPSVPAAEPGRPPPPDPHEPIPF